MRGPASRPGAGTAAIAGGLEVGVTATELRQLAGPALLDCPGIGLAASWGGGLVASMDGLRIVVPVATINAGPNPRYFGVRRVVLAADSYERSHAAAIARR